MKKLVILIVLVLMGCSPEMRSVPHTKYRFEPITLPDGTPCYIIKGGSHSGMIGITCDYNQELDNV